MSKLSAAVSQEDDFDYVVKSSLGLVAKVAKEKPDISYLHDAVVFLDDGTPVFVPEVGDHVVIERPRLGSMTEWFDTRMYCVKEVNEENGNLSLFDTECDCWAGSNYLTGSSKGLLFKIPPKGWSLSAAIRAAQKKKEKKLKKEKVPKPAGQKRKKKK